MTRRDAAHYWYGGINAVAAAIFTLLAAALAFNLGSALGISYYEEQAFAVAVGLALFLTYHRPAGGKIARSARRAAIESVGAWIILVATLVFAWRFEDYTLAIVQQPPEIVIGGTVLVVALLEAVRRVAGLSLVFVILAIFGYTLFGRYLPSDFAAPATDFGATIAYVVGDANAILGAPVAVAVIVVIPFIFMGEVLRASNGSTFFTDLALAAVGRSAGGSAKVAVISSGLVGMVSGSAVGNVVTAGVITIPLMKRAGYPAEKAAAIEAVASTGGQLMPPVMGAAAFLMAEFLQIPYATIVVAAIIPALLYYGQLFLSVHLIAKRDGIAGVALDGTRALAILKRGWFFLGGLLALLLMLLSGQWRPETAAFLAAAFFALCGVVLGYGRLRMKLGQCFGAVDRRGALVDRHRRHLGRGRHRRRPAQRVGAVVLALGVSDQPGRQQRVPAPGLHRGRLDPAGHGHADDGRLCAARDHRRAGIGAARHPAARRAFLHLLFRHDVDDHAAGRHGRLRRRQPRGLGPDAHRLDRDGARLAGVRAAVPPDRDAGLDVHRAAAAHIAEAALAAVGIAAITAGAFGYCRQALGVQARSILLPAGAFCLLSFLPGDALFALRLVVAIAVVLWMSGVLAKRAPRVALR